MTIQTTPSIFTAVPAYGQILTGQTVTSLIGLTRSLLANGMAGGFGTLSFPDIVEIRNIFLSIWYDKIMSSHLLFIDADMGFDPQLIMDMIGFNKPLVGALCPKRKLPIEFAGRAKAGQCRIINGFMEVEGVGGAIMLIRRDAVDAIMAKFPELSDEITIKNHAAKELMDQYGLKRIIKCFDKLIVNGETFSEDLSFCLRHRMSHPENDPAGEVWANITHNVIHVGPHEFQGNYFEHIKDMIKPVGSDAVEAAGPLEPIPPEVQAALLQAAE